MTLIKRRVDIFDAHTGEFVTELGRGSHCRFAPNGAFVAMVSVRPMTEAAHPHMHQRKARLNLFDTGKTDQALWGAKGQGIPVRVHTLHNAGNPEP